MQIGHACAMWCNFQLLRMGEPGQIWLVDMISMAASRERETVALQGERSGAAGLGARSQVSMSRTGMGQPSRQPVTRPICLHCAIDCQCEKGTQSFLSS
jgi:hypothetical protein